MKILLSIETVAVVINVRDNRGAIRIFKLERDKYINIIEIKKAGKQVMIF
jgi:hypothetical protein